MKQLIIPTLAAMLLASPALAAPKLKTFSLDETGCAENVSVKKGERYRIAAKHSGLALSLSDGSVTLYNAAGKMVRLEHTAPDEGEYRQFAALNKGNYVLKINKSQTIQDLCVNAAN